MLETLSQKREPALEDGDAVIRLSHVHKIYPMGDFEVHALRGISLGIKRGEFVAIMGPSGSGKSTMMNIIGCLDRPTKGHYFLEGVDVSTVDKPGLADIGGYPKPARRVCLPELQPRSAHVRLGKC